MKSLVNSLVFFLLYLIPSMVSGYNMCSSITSTDSSAAIYDAGGPTLNYGNSQNCQFLIDPGCNASITLTFSSFNLEYTYDFLFVYDGSSTSGKLLLTASGNVIPAPVTAYSGKMYLVFTSDPSVTLSGFSANWSSVMIHNKPVANFLFPLQPSPLNSPVLLKDISLNHPSRWHWNFGDGDTSNLQHPTHQFRKFDTFSVKLITYNCFGKDSILHQVFMQDTAIIHYSPDSFSQVSSTCSQIQSASIKIKNSGRGDLVYHFSGGDSIPGIRMLALTYGVDYANEYKNTLDAISQYSQNITLSEKNTTHPDTLKKALQNKEILLIAEQEWGSSAIFSTFKKVISDFVYQGGNVVFCGSASSQANCMFNTGLFHGSFSRNASGKRLTVLNRNHPLTNNLDSMFYASDAVYSCRFTDPNIILLAADSVNAVFAFREYGNGKAFFIANDFNSYDSNEAKMLSNIFKWVNTGLLPAWIVINTSSDTLAPNDSNTVAITFRTNGLRAGIYAATLKLHSNDIKNPTRNIRCSMKINGNPVMMLSDSNLNFDSCMQYADIPDTLTMYNSGCDTLKITGLHFKTPHYYVQPSSLNVLPGEYRQLLIHFNPKLTGTFTDTLTIISNYTTSYVRLHGTAVFPSSANVTPDSFLTTMLCEDSTQFFLKIKNTGPAPLIYSIDGENAHDTVRLLALTYGTDYFWEYSNTIAGINNLFTDYRLSEINTTSPIRLDSALQKNDVLLIPEQETGQTTVFSSFSTILQNFVTSGGTVIFCGAFGTQMNCMFSTGLFSGTPGPIVFNNNFFLNVHDTLHELAKGLGSVMPSLNATFTANITNPDAVRLIDYDGTYDVASCRYIGKGKAVFVAFDFFDYDTNSSRVVANAIKNAASHLKPLWINLSDFNDTIAQGDSSVINVKLNTRNVLAGSFNYNITIHTNDPVKNTITVPVNINVHCKPYANFSVFSNYVNRNDSIAFTDKSKNFPTSWEWTFQGAVPASSVIQHPNALYPNYGNYDVRLVVSNAWGSDTLQKNAFVQVQNVAYMCNGYSTSYDSGYVFDVGGPLYKYNAMQTCELLIAPPCASSITLEFYEFNVENNWDYLYIYDGADAKGTLLKTLTGNTLPAPITAFSGKMFIKFVTDQLVEESGFTAKWTSVIPPGNPPSVSLGVNNFNPPVKSQIQFNDNSVPIPDYWFWDFGDGTTTKTQHPAHIYYHPGIYPVKFRAGNCYGADSVSTLITVQDYPVMNYQPATISGKSTCDDYDTVLLSVYNRGNGALTLETDTGQRRRLELLAYTYGINTDEAYPNTLKALYRHYPDISLTEISTLDTNKLRKALAGKDIFLVPEEEKGIPGVFYDFSYPLQEFVNKGGTIIFCGSYDVQSECMFNTGLFNGSYNDYVYLPSDSITITDITNPITSGFGNKLPSDVITYYYNITNSDAVRLMTFNNHDVLTYRKIGLGTAIFIGYNFYRFSDTISQIFGNIVHWATSNPVPSWMKVVPSKAVVTDSFEIKIMFDRTKTSGYISTAMLSIYTNDTLASRLNIPVHFNTSKKYAAVDLVPGIQFCSGDSGTLRAGNNFKTYLWNDSISGDSIFTATTGGKIWVVVTDSNNCSSSDTSLITENLLPQVYIQPLDSIYCSNNNPVKLFAMPAGGVFSGDSISSGYFFPEFSGPGPTGIYYFYTDSNQCSNNDSIFTTVLVSPKVNIGTDTTLYIGDTMVIDAGAGYISTVWNKILDSRYLYISASIPGKYLYYVDVTDSNGCTGSDSIYVTIRDTFVSVGSAHGNFYVRIYPNPASNVLFVEYSHPVKENSLIKIFSSDGREMISHKINTSVSLRAVIDISRLAKGIYTLEVFYHNTPERFKVVIY